MSASDIYAALCTALHQVSRRPKAEDCMLRNPAVCQPYWWDRVEDLQFRRLRPIELCTGDARVDGERTRCINRVVKKPWWKNFYKLVKERQYTQLLIADFEDCVSPMLSFCRFLDCEGFEGIIRGDGTEIIPPKYGRIHDFYREDGRIVAVASSPLTAKVGIVVEGLGVVEELDHSFVERIDSATLLIDDRRYITEIMLQSPESVVVEDDMTTEEIQEAFELVEKKRSVPIRTGRLWKASGAQSEDFSYRGRVVPTTLDGRSFFMSSTSTQTFYMSSTKPQTRLIDAARLETIAIFEEQAYVTNSQGNAGPELSIFSPKIAAMPIVLDVKDELQLILNERGKPTLLSSSSQQRVIPASSLIDDCVRRLREVPRESSQALDLFHELLMFADALQRSRKALQTAQHPQLL